MPTAVVIGVGPGLGMSIARRFGRAGYGVALVSRSDARHAGYLAELAAEGIEAEAFAADIHHREPTASVLDAIEAKRGIDVLYYGPGAGDVSRPAPITRTTVEEVRSSMKVVYSAVDVVGRVLPSMIARGSGALLFAGGVSAVTPIPFLGALALSSAALRNYVLTLNAGLADTGVYAGTLTIGGLIERGDIHGYVMAHPENFGDLPPATLNPDDIAATAWEMFSVRDRAEEVLSVLS